MLTFHPAVSSWFAERFREPSEAQEKGWPPIQKGGNVLLAAPTGSGKTLAAFLCAIDRLVQQGVSGQLNDLTQVLYISPLKALANDVRHNLLDPLREIRRVAKRLELDLPEIRPAVRSGDTLAGERRHMMQRPPHILVTTPESLFILLTSEGGRQILKTIRTVIVDEIHSLARDKRGSHLALSLERLEVLTERSFQRIGLSATQKPIEAIARFLVGPDRALTMVDLGHRRKMNLAVEVPKDELGAVASNEMWEEIYDRLAELIGQHRTTLVFVNTRRLAERVAHHLGERLGKQAVAAHHGSLSREIRLRTEERLKNGGLQVVVATASLELGIDIGNVDLVCQIGSTRSIALALQRIGRSGHWKGAIPHGRIFAMTRDELLECGALVRSIRSGELDPIQIPPSPLDILAQQIVAAVACDEWKEEKLFNLFRRAAPFSVLPREQFEAVVTMLSEGISTRQGRRGAYLHRDRVNGKIRARRGARLAAITSGGAIPDRADYQVKADPEEVVVGTLDEDFAMESMRGDIFLLGNTSWRIRRVEANAVRVEDAHGAPPNVPFWRGEAPGRTAELSSAFSRLRQQLAPLEPAEGVKWLQEECGLDRRGAEQAVCYVLSGSNALGATPSQDCVVAERFFDEAGGMQLVLHAPFGSRVNKAWGLALRKRFCRTFNFELQAAATENGVLISLGDQHSFPLDSVFSFLSSHRLRDLLVQALLAAPLFPTRWRWNASRALAVKRFSGGGKVPSPLQRIRSDEILAAVFPEQAACLENIQGDIEVPNHPLVFETVRDCLTEAMDVEGLTEILEKIETGVIRCIAIDTREPSPFSHEILNANPYAFLDDAPLEERRARAVQTRRTLLPQDADELGALDDQAIQQVAKEAWPPLRSPDELHDALLTLGILPRVKASSLEEFFERLVGEGRAHRLTLEKQTDQNLTYGKKVFWVTAERSSLVRKVYPHGCLSPQPGNIECLWQRDRGLDQPAALQELLRGRLESTGPATAAELAQLFCIPLKQIEAALSALEGEGQILRGFFRRSTVELQWCDRRLLARIHRLTIGRLRREIDPMSPAEFMRFLFRWQHVAEGTQLHGEKGLSIVLEQFQGFEAAATAWESFLLPKRISDYTPELLDKLCLSGQFVWGRLTLPSALVKEDWSVEQPPSSGGGIRPSRVAPLSFFRRQEMPHFLAVQRDDLSLKVEEVIEDLNLSHPAREILHHLQHRGASFFDDLVGTTRRLPVEVEEGLWELVTAGLVTADGFDNLRLLIDPARRLGRNRFSKRRRRLSQSYGRWTLLDFREAPFISNRGEKSDPEPKLQTCGELELDLEPVARQLLRRWGVVFRDLLARESLSVPWRDLLRVYRRLEARGEIRGGRFVSGFVGEQFTLPEAVDALRTVRRREPTGETVRISAADPLNLKGIVTPGQRVRPHPKTLLYYRDGVPVDENASPLYRSLVESASAGPPPPPR